MPVSSYRKLETTNDIFFLLEAFENEKKISKMYFIKTKKKYYLIRKFAIVIEIELEYGINRKYFINTIYSLFYVQHSGTDPKTF